MHPKRSKPEAGARTAPRSGARAQSIAKKPVSKSVKAVGKSVSKKQRVKRGGARPGEVKKRKPRKARVLLPGKETEPGLVALTPEEERFCQLIAKGVFSNYSCYLQVHPTVQTSTARTESSKLLTKPNIQQRIEWYRAEARKNVVHDITESILWCKRVIETPVGYVDDESPLAQEVQREEIEMGGSRGQLKRGQAESGNEESGPAATLVKVKVKMPDKMRAQQHLDALLGHTKADKENERQGNAIVDLLQWIRGGANVSGKGGPAQGE